MADIQEAGNGAPAGSDTASPAANEQTESATVKESSDAVSQENANEPADGTGAETDNGESGEPKKPKSEFQKRIDRLTRQRAAAERDRDRLAQELDRERTAKAPSETRQADAEPKLADYSDYETFQKALTTWTVKHTLKQDQESRTAAERQRRTADLEEQRRESFLESSDAAREKHEDYDEVVFSDENQMPRWAGGLIADTDNPGEVAYFLAKNPKETKRIFSQHPLKAAIALGKLETKISTPPAKRLSNAPPPISAPATGGRAAKTLSGMSPDEIYAKLKG